MKSISTFLRQNTEAYDRELWQAQESQGRRKAFQLREYFHECGINSSFYISLKRALGWLPYELLKFNPSPHREPSETSSSDTS